LVLKGNDPSPVRIVDHVFMQTLQRHGFRVLDADGLGLGREGHQLSFDDVPTAQRLGRRWGIDIMVRGLSQVHVLDKIRLEILGNREVGGSKAVVTAQAFLVHSGTLLPAGPEEVADLIDNTGTKPLAWAAERIAEGLSERIWDTLSPQPSCGLSSLPMNQPTGYRKRWAVVIGIKDYPKDSGWKGLGAPVNDALAMATRLRQLGFDVLPPLYNSDATRQAILRVLGDELAKEAQAEDQVVVFFAGHGHTETLQNGSKVGYIIPFDGHKKAPFATSISMTLLQHLADRFCAKHLFYIMDACYSGLLLRAPDGDLWRRRGIFVMTAGREGEDAVERGGYGLFTYAVLRGLDGSAERDGDGVLTARKLYWYVEEHVRRASQGKQHPLFHPDPTPRPREPWKEFLFLRPFGEKERP
jgi:hypothetical protein